MRYTFAESLSQKGFAKMPNGTCYKVVRTEDERGYGIEKVTFDGSRSLTQDTSGVGWTISEARRKAHEDAKPDDKLIHRY